jgi:signal transduction histidine kinase
VLLNKDKQIQLQEINKQKLMRNGFIAGFTVVLLFAGLFFRQRNKIRKGNAALQIAKERAEQSEQFKQQFLAKMSHEIRTPINAVMGMTRLALDTPLREKQKFYLEGIKKSGDTLLHIINDILDLSKIEAGKMELEKIDFSLSDTLKQVNQTLNHKAEEKGLELLASIDPEIDDVVMGDPVRLNQALINLAGNALKFTERGSVSIVVTKGISASSLQFSIIDTGIGIPQEKLQTVFENFTQVNASDNRKYGGTGLGLSISRQLVELMGGKISILDYLTKFCEGDQARIKKYIDMFLSSAPILLEKIKLALESNDHGEIAGQMHGYKTKFMMMGMKEAQNLATEIEIKCLQGNPMDSIQVMLLLLVQEVETAAAELNSSSSFIFG